MKISANELREAEVLLTTAGWDVYTRWLKEAQAEYHDRVHDELEDSITSILKREQILGAEKRLKHLQADFKNFLLTQKETHHGHRD